ncbi:MAG: hypothetical protein BAJATHORv1_20513 [Candidatus Thorarchaeota archaeon]|nr:MAG: hypothetical protein BAJATHORv1_20513 [Candidatus Thorarchaeota archaeon]
MYFSIPMKPTRHWILGIAGVICIMLAVIGGMSYPLTEEPLLTVILYELVIIPPIFCILYLAYRRGLPAEQQP